jgi:DNA gyrase/topoisomerase IV subunit B
MDATIQKIKGTSIHEILDNDAFSSVIAAIGTGISLPDGLAQARTFLDHMRHGKIIIVTDATAEGRYILTQTVALFYRFMNPLFGAKRVYRAVSDLLPSMGTDEFAAKVMKPASRRVVQVEAGSSMTQTLSLLDSTEG